MGGAALGSRQKDAFRIGEDAANVIKSAYKLRACVDRHVQDMVVVLMALAEGRSRIKTEPLTLHTQTAIHVAQMMTDVSSHKCSFKFGAHLNLQFLISGEIHRHRAGERQLHH